MNEQTKSFDAKEVARFLSVITKSLIPKSSPLLALRDIAYDVLPVWERFSNQGDEKELVYLKTLLDDAKNYIVDIEAGKGLRDGATIPSEAITGFKQQSDLFEEYLNIVLSEN